jgi:hypothetical protein
LNKYLLPTTTILKIAFYHFHPSDGAALAAWVSTAKLEIMKAAFTTYARFCFSKPVKTVKGVPGASSFSFPGQAEVSGRSMFPGRLSSGEGLSSSIFKIYTFIA